MKRMKNDPRKKLHMDRQLLLKMEMTLIVVISVITVTIAWFCLRNSAWGRDLTLGTLNADYIRVALTAGGEDVTRLDESERYIDINMPNFYNVEQNAEGETLMAPGVSGELKLYITALSPNVRSCRINTECIPLFGTEEEGLTEEQRSQQEKLQKLVKGHIQFYTNRSYDPDAGTYSFSGLIGEGSADSQYATFTVPLVQNREEPVTIYWVWFYEYTDIPTEGRARTDAGYYCDMDRLNAYLAANGKSLETLTDDERELYFYDYYDYGDTLIGLNVPEVKFHIVVNALDENETELGQ
ncbi:MAG: hypothetical protein ACI4DO_02970 [Roseburia sp.]